MTLGEGDTIQPILGWGAKWGSADGGQGGGLWGGLEESGRITALPPKPPHHGSQIVGLVP